jgi:hypothetical protein
MTAPVKGFRTPAGTGVEGCTEAGVRKASREETAGGVCAGGGVSLWGSNANVRSDFSVPDRDDGRASIVRLVLVAPGAIGTVASC